MTVYSSYLRLIIRANHYKHLAWEIDLQLSPAVTELESCFYPFQDTLIKTETKRQCFTFYLKRPSRTLIVFSLE